VSNGVCVFCERRTAAFFGANGKHVTCDRCSPFLNGLQRGDDRMLTIAQTAVSRGAKLSLSSDGYCVGFDIDALIAQYSPEFVTPRDIEMMFGEREAQRHEEARKAFARAAKAQPAKPAWKREEEILEEPVYQCPDIQAYRLFGSEPIGVDFLKSTEMARAWELYLSAVILGVEPERLRMCAESILHAVRTVKSADEVIAAEIRGMEL
jgi:hypothetical protein